MTGPVRPVRVDVRFCRVGGLPSKGPIALIANGITKVLVENTEARPGDVEIVFHVSEGDYWFKGGKSISTIESERD